jgi:hypothetical protein
MSAVRTGGFKGRIIFRTIQINLGFNRCGQENCVKLELNQLARESARAGEFQKSNVEVLDVEALTGSRPETFVHENTNHFYCECKVGGKKNRCPAAGPCLRKRTDRFENGELSRVVAQLVMAAVDGDGIAGEDPEVSDSGQRRCKVPPKSPPYKGRASTCAVVFASGVLLRKPYGAAIDCHDHVYRMNAHTMAGYEEYTGSRTTHETVSFYNKVGKHSSPAEAFVREFDPSVVGVSFGVHINRGAKPHLQRKHPNWQFYANFKAILTSDSLLRNSSGWDFIQKYKDPSSGFFTLALALSHCDQVNLFGSVNDCHYPYHYSSVQPKDLPYQPLECSSVYSLKNHSKGRGHKFMDEHQICDELEKEGLITQDSFDVACCSPNTARKGGSLLVGCYQSFDPAQFRSWEANKIVLLNGRCYKPRRRCRGTMLPGHGSFCSRDVMGDPVKCPASACGSDSALS